MSEQPPEETVQEPDEVEEEPVAVPEPAPQASTLPASATHTERDPTQDEDPTYLVEPWAGLSHFVCLLDGHEDWNLDSFTQHMQLYHRGIMRVAPPGPGPGPEDPASAAVDAAEEGSGQTPETATADPEALPETPADEGV